MNVTVTVSVEKLQEEGERKHFSFFPGFIYIISFNHNNSDIMPIRTDEETGAQRNELSSSDHIVTGTRDEADPGTAICKLLNPQILFAPLLNEDHHAQPRELS